MANTKKIPVSQLKPGMFVEEIDISWLKSPFLRHRRKINSEQDILLYKQYGVKIITINLDQGVDVDTETEAAPTPTIQTTSSSDTTTENNPQTLIEKPKIELGFAKELEAAKVIKSKIQTLAKQLNQEIKSGRPVNIKDVKAVIQETVDSLKRNDQALLTMLHLHRKDVRLDSHLFGTFSLVLPLALKTNLANEQLEILGMAALLHDCGWSLLPLNLFGKGKNYTSSENKLINHHASLAAHALRKNPGIADDIIQLIEYHHEIPTKNKATAKTPLPQLPPLLEYLQLADHYDEYIHGLTDKPGVLPVNALKILYNESKSGYFSEKLVTEFVRILGIYPISTIVKLSSGENAIVCEVNRKHPFFPKIIIFQDDNQQQVSTTIVDLKQDSFKRTIKEVLSPSQVGINPIDILEKI